MSHPTGTKIIIGRHDSQETTFIQNIKDGDAVVGWNRHAQKMVAGRKVAFSTKTYNGKMFRMAVGTKSVSMTSDHRLLARWSDRGVKTCVTYLMWRQNFGFRVGWCKLFAATLGGYFQLHVSHRCRIEKADKVWVLSAHESRTEASVYESILAAKHGIPTSTFEPVSGAVHQNRKAIRQIFIAVAGENHARGLKILEEHDRYFDQPLYPWIGRTRSSVRGGRMTYFETYVSNVLPGLMSVPLPGERNLWAPVTGLSARNFSGVVYSIDVEKDKSYSANGMIVLSRLMLRRGKS